MGVIVIAPRIIKGVDWMVPGKENNRISGPKEKQNEKESKRSSGKNPSGGLFSFSDTITYADGNLQDHTPWTYAFATCATVIGFIVSNAFRASGDTVTNDWSAIRVSTAPYVKSWDLSIKINGFPVNTTAFRAAFGLVVTTTTPAFTLGRFFGMAARRVSNGGAINCTAVDFTQGPCSTVDSQTINASSAANDILRMVCTPSGANDVAVDYYKNGVLQISRTHVLGANAGCQPAFAVCGLAGGTGFVDFDNVSCDQTGVL
jgi:hypothetical protein